MNEAVSWTVPADHPAFAGHFPGTPILPGAMLLDKVLQIVAADANIALDSCEFRAVKFLHPVRPGEELEIFHSRLTNGTIRFEVLVGTRRIAVGELLPNAVIPP
jgi:3-hydroxyacyl-[acyl-carrier-protein] dehydratase